ncbi:MAG: hypothetical protein DF168_02239 [Candidatus Moanabacter tarae]|uniref:Uncharacterized protein n=1 Tax=Candidatus Moanibacter tarae TaxID=2200854 RepID=A0A2Z4AKE9_9BACT|nr:MAG: hypothetical protein DF168_02239 [Candidatus Moanabacter tarae]
MTFCNLAHLETISFKLLNHRKSKWSLGLPIVIIRYVIIPTLFSPYFFDFRDLMLFQLMELSTTRIIIPPPLFLILYSKPLADLKKV